MDIGWTCSKSSQSVAEPLYGTASHAEHWLLLEYEDAWGHKAFEESDIPAVVKTRLAATGAKLLLIRQPARRSAQKSLFSVRLGAQSGAIHRFLFDTYDAILDFDFGDDTAAERYTGPLFAVCVNGKRDLCCAKQGIPFFNALSAIAPDATWQCSHIGGHRFAATMLCFPQGICYGRLTPQDAKALIAQYERGQLLLGKLRGCCAHPQPVQSAEYYIRATTGRIGFDDFRLLDTNTDGPVWVIRFVAPNGDIHLVRLIESESDFAVQQSCGAEPKPVPHYRLVRHQIIETA